MQKVFKLTLLLSILVVVAHIVYAAIEPSLPDDVWNVPTLIQTYDVYNSPRGVYIRSKVDEVERVANIEGMKNQRIMHGYECSKRLLLNAEDGHYYAVRRGEIMATRIHGLPGLSDMSSINNQTCDAILRVFRLQFYGSKADGSVDMTKAYDRRPADCSTCNYIGMKEVFYKLLGEDLNATQVTDEKEIGEAKHQIQKFYDERFPN